MLKLIQTTFCLLIGLTLQAHAQSFTWYNPMETSPSCISGRAWNEEIKASYARMPERLQRNMPEKVRNFSKNAAGLSIMFTTNTRNLQIKYTIEPGAQMVNMARLNQAGVDLYATNKRGKTHWIGNHMQWNWKDTITFTFRDLETKTGVYELFLPPYSTITSLKIGCDKKADLTFVPTRTDKPVVIYGSSIVQGASPSRPGLTWTNTLKRITGLNIVNLGFSGSCLMEPEVFDAICEIDARCFVIDPIPNSYRLTANEIATRIRYGVTQIRQRSYAPIIISESYLQADRAFHPHAEDQLRKANKALCHIVKLLQKEGVKNLFLMKSKDIKMTEDAMIEATHPNDIGCIIYANAYKKKLKKVLR